MPIRVRLCGFSCSRIVFNADYIDLFGTEKSLLGDWDSRSLKLSALAIQFVDTFLNTVEVKILCQLNYLVTKRRHGRRVGFQIFSN